jgi:hypothetical protein
MTTYSPSDIALFIGAALNHRLPPGNGTGFMSTIAVHQYKSKFSEVRNYCTLAQSDLVQDLWNDLKRGGTPSEDFIRSCLISDARHYRRCYLAMIAILSDKEEGLKLRNSADHPEILFFDKGELDTFLQTQDSFLLQKWRVSDESALKEILYQICHFGA